jgi:hypothetical protein
MPSTYDPLLRLELQAVGENATTWGVKTNNNLDLIAAAIAGSAVVSVSSGNTTLSTANAANDQARCAILLIEGTLTGNVNIIVPAAPKNYATIRNTTGAFSVIINNGGTGATLSSSGPDLIICTSTTCVNLVGSLAASVSALQTQVNTVSVAVSVVAAATSALQIQVNAVSAAVSAVATSVSTLQIQVNTVSAAVSSINANSIRILE